MTFFPKLFKQGFFKPTFNFFLNVFSLVGNYSQLILILLPYVQFCIVAASLTKLLQTTRFVHAWHLQHQQNTLIKPPQTYGHFCPLCLCSLHTANLIHSFKLKDWKRCPCLSEMHCSANLCIMSKSSYDWKWVF